MNSKSIFVVIGLFAALTGPVLVAAPVPQARHINGPRVYGCRPGNPFIYRIPATGGRPMTFTATGLPGGLHLDKHTGIITGRVTARGSYAVLLRSTNSGGSDTRPFRIVCGDKLCLTPPMGWNDWYAHYGRITDAMMREAADKLVSSGLADAGYQYVNIDDCWANTQHSPDPLRMGPARDAKGNILPNSYFPDMRSLTDYIHARGLKAGIYTSPGATTCAGFTGSLGHEAQDAGQFASWGFDFLKYDYCSYENLEDSLRRKYPALTPMQQMQRPYKQMGDLLKAQGRDMVLNLCQYGRNEVWKWGREAGQSWRTGGDLGGELSHIFDVALRNAAIGAYNGPGSWNDPDYIQIGYVGNADGEGMPEPSRLTLSEQRAFMSLWCLLAAPLFYSGDLTKLDSLTLDILCNREAIDVDQDPLGRSARVVRQSGETFTLVKDLEDGGKAIGLCNRGSYAAEINVRWTEAGLSAESCTVRDCWQHRDLGSCREGYSVTVPAGAVVMVKVMPVRGASLVRPRLNTVVLEADKKVLNPIQHPGETAHLSVRGIFSDGTTGVLPQGSVTYTAHNKLACDDMPVVTLSGDSVIPSEGGIATVSAVVQFDGETFSAATDITVRPYYRDYHQTLVLKLFMGMEGEPVPRLEGLSPFDKPHDVICTFGQALDVIRATDNLTRGIPKILYLVGWQKGGHDHLYPSWDSVNPRLKREEDSTALQSLRWLIRAARQYNTTVSLHINMVDAYRSSPLFEEYVRKDLLARDTVGRLYVRDMQIKWDSMYVVSYTREWEAGLAQRRIDRLIAMVPELKEGHTIHIDAFIARSDGQASLSPWHALPQHGGINMYKEAATQHKIFRYWRRKGFDVTGEGIFWAHPPGEGFYGLQPMSWWYPADAEYEMRTPEQLSARGGTDRHGDGDFRFGNSIHGEEIYLKDKDSLPGMLGQFCRNTLPWYYLSRLERSALIKDTLFYSGGVKAFAEGGHKIIRRGKFTLRDNDDVFVPALWKEKEIIAYSREGYTKRRWLLPEDWGQVHKVDIYAITLQGLSMIAKGVPVADGSITLTLSKEMAVSIVAE